MTIRVFNGSNWSNIAQRINVFRAGIGWTRASKLSVWRGNDSTGFWSVAYPDLPISTVTPTVNGNGAPGTNFNLSTLFIWNLDDYVAPTSITYQWQRSTSTTGPWSNVGSLLTSYAPYTIQSADDGYFFRCQITGTNARGSTVVNSSNSVQVDDPSYTFNFNQEFGVNANAAIFFDKTSGSFPNSNSLFVLGRVLTYFFGDYKQFALWYRSDSSTFRIYHQMYRQDRTSRPASPDIEYEIVFTNGSNIVDVFVVNPISTVYITSYVAYLRTLISYKSYNSADYAAGKRFRVTLDGTTPISVANASASTTSPSSLDGWIYIGSNLDSTDITIPFLQGNNQSSPSAPQFLFSEFASPFSKSNMYFPKTPTISSITYSTSTTATVSWSYPSANAFNGQSFTVQVYNSGNTSILSTQSTTSNSITVSGLSQGTSYNIFVYPNSRPDVYGQFGFSNSQSYLHATVPGAPTSVSGTSGSSQVALSWTAPASNGGSAITGYSVRHSTNGGVSWSTPVSTGSTSTSYTVTGLTNGTSYIFQVAAINSIGTGPWSASSSSVTPQPTASQISVSVSPTSILTLGVTSTITAQLQDSSGNSVSISGRSISISSSNTNAATVSPSPITTGSTGSATSTATSGNSGGTVTITGASTGLTSGTATLTVNLRPALNPTLTATGTSKGVSFTHTNYNSQYTFGLWTGPTVGSLEPGDSYNSSQFDILVPILFNVRPTVTVGTRRADVNLNPGGTPCWTPNRSTSLTTFTTRTGYSAGFSNTPNVSSNRTVTYAYLWQFSTDNGATWRTDWPVAFSGTTSATLTWTGTPNTRRIRCRVTINGNDGTSDQRFTSNEPTIP